MIVYKDGLPIDEIKREISNNKTTDVWVVFAYFSEGLLQEILELVLLREESDEPLKSFTLVLDSSSTNPLHLVAKYIVSVSKKLAGRFVFSLVMNKLMHAKLFATLSDDGMYLYMGSANLTQKAIKGNVECGVVRRCENENDIECLRSYINGLLETCKELESLKRLEDIATLAHFRSEIRFLALEKCKIEQATKFKLPPFGASEEDSQTVEEEGSQIRTVTKKKTEIYILLENDRESLENRIQDLRILIRSNFAINLENSYGLVSSVWTLKEAKNDPDIEFVFKGLHNVLNHLKEKYSRSDTREAVKELAKKEIKSLLNDGGVISQKEVDSYIQSLLERFDEIGGKKDPYYRFFNLCARWTATKEISDLFSVYRAGGSPEEIGFYYPDDNDHDIYEPTADQINLSVMCHLALALRNKIRNIPAVWWFDVGLLKDFYAAKEKEYSKNMLKEVDNKIFDQCSIFECLSEFKNITGFGLSLAYPRFEPSGLYSPKLGYPRLDNRIFYRIKANGFSGASVNLSGRSYTIYLQSKLLLDNGWEESCPQKGIGLQLGKDVILTKASDIKGRKKNKSPLKAISKKENLYFERVV